MTMMARTAAAATLVLAMVTGAQALTVEKAPDLGGYWQPLNPIGGTYIYANSFVAPEAGAVTGLGFWAMTSNGGAGSAAQVRLQVYGAGPAPVASNVVAQTAVIDFIVTSSLSLVEAEVIGGGLLTAGETYWFAASVLGFAAQPELQVGGHAQNSGGIADGGTFWFSNDPSGADFDGRDLTPEMAFRVGIGAVPSVDDAPQSTGASVPVPAAAPLLIGALGALGLARRRRRG